MGLLELSDKWNKINFIDLAGDVLATMDKFIADLNRDQLIDKGIRPDGSDITPEYTSYTKFLKKTYGNGIGGITDHVTLFGEGNLHKSIFSSVIGDEVILDATDSKTSDLLGKYGDWLGLTDDSINKLRVEFYPKYIAAIEKALS